MYILKQLPEDFIVREISNLQASDSGRYVYIKVTKKNRNTLDVVKELAKQLHILEKKIGFAGSKDKHAITEQVMSLFSVKKEKIEQVKIENVEIEILGFSDEGIHLGDLQGNSFEIVSRNLDGNEVENIKKYFRNKTIFVENYFDEQRFSEHNVEIGRKLILKDFKGAVELVNEEKVQRYRKEKTTDAVGALRIVSKRMLKMYVHAYQSFLWNESVRMLLEKLEINGKKIGYSEGEFLFADNTSEKLKNLEIPLIGFNYEELLGRVNEKYRQELQEIIGIIMKKEKLSKFGFVVKQIPELSLEGEMRKMYSKVEELEVGNVEQDELNKGNSKVNVGFKLGKGSYATIVMRKLLG